MQHYHFSGNLAQIVGFNQTSAGKNVCKFTLIKDEFVKMDEKTGEKIERKVAILFTAFGHDAKYINDYLIIGDQLSVYSRVENNNYTDKITGEKIYNRYNFIVTGIEKGADGKRRKEKNKEEALKYDE